MNFIDEEVEIKIEYYEDPDKDPLINETTIAEDDLDNLELPKSIKLAYIPEPTNIAHSEVGQSNNTKIIYKNEIKNSHCIIANKANNISNEQLICPICKLSFTRKTTLKNHIVSRHSDNKPFLCDLCPYKAPLKYYLDLHISAKHPETEYAKSKKSHFCDKCGYSTPRKSHFINHKNLHTNTKPYKCSICDYATGNHANLLVHNRTHTREKPYFCTDCDYRCSTKSGLKSHKLTHNRENKVLYCNKCLYNTVYKQSLNRHIQTHISK